VNVRENKCSNKHIDNIKSQKSSKGQGTLMPSLPDALFESKELSVFVTSGGKRCKIKGIQRISDINFRGVGS